MLALSMASIAVLGIGVLMVGDTDSQTPASAGPELILREHRFPVRAVAFAADAGVLAAGGGVLGQVDELMLWNPATSSNQPVVGGHKNRIELLAISPDGETLAAGDDGGNVRLYDRSTGAEQIILRGRGGFLSALAFSQDGCTLAAANTDGTFYLWNTADWTMPRQMQIPVGRVHSVVFLDTDPLLAIGCAVERCVKVWDAAAGRARAIFPAETGALACAALSSSGSLLAAGRMDGTVTLWDLGTLQARLVVDAHRSSVTALVFSRDERLLATGSLDMLVKVWEVTTGRELATLEGNTDTVHTLAFAKDSTRLASGGDDKTVILWNTSALRTR